MNQFGVECMYLHIGKSDTESTIEELREEVILRERPRWLSEKANGSSTVSSILETKFPVLKTRRPTQSTFNGPVLG